MGLVEFIFILGLELGVALSGPLYDLGGYEVVYILSSIVILCGLLIVPFLVDKPKQVLNPTTGAVIDVTDHEDAENIRSGLVSNRAKLKALFQADHPVETLKAGLKERPQNG